MPEHGGFLEQAQIQRLFTQLDLLRSQWDQTDQQRRADPYAITQRSVDEAQTAGHRVYTAAGSLTAAALDNLDALRALLRPGGGIGPWAPYNLIRGAFLPAVWAIWMLEPLDSKERRIRGLRFAIVDEKEWEAFRFAFPNNAEQATHFAARHAEVTKTYHEEADHLGLKWSVARTPINLVQELPKLKTLHTTSDDSMATVVGLWRGMSGIAHGYGYAVQAFSDVRIDSKTEKGATVTTFVNDSRLADILHVTGWAVISAMTLYRTRNLDPIQ